MVAFVFLSQHELDKLPRASAELLRIYSTTARGWQASDVNAVAHAGKDEGWPRLPLHIPATAVPSPGWEATDGPLDGIGSVALHFMVMCQSCGRT